MTGPRGGKKYEYWKRTFFSDSIQLILRVSCQEISRRSWRIQKEGSIILTVKYADGLTLLAKEEALLQGTTAKNFGMEINVEK
jgi:hypothetical protein